MKFKLYISQHSIVYTALIAVIYSYVIMNILPVILVVLFVLFTYPVLADEYIERLKDWGLHESS